MQGPNPPGSAEMDVTQHRAFADKYGLDSSFIT